jgi:hypothetical protein
MAKSCAQNGFHELGRAEASPPHDTNPMSRTSDHETTVSHRNEALDTNA